MDTRNDLLVLVLAFTSAGCAVLAQSDTIWPQARIAAAAVAAGATAVLALLKRPGQHGPPEGGLRG